MEYIKDKSNRIIGFLNEVGTNRKEIRSGSNNLVGWFNVAADKTFKKDGTFYGFGDQRLRLLDK